MSEVRKRSDIICGTRLAWREAGDTGPWVFMIHGWADCARVWGRALRRWSDRARLVAVDVPGHGASDPTPTSDGLDGIDRALIALMDYLGIETARVIGHSFGGMLAMRLALAAPERVERLVLVAPAWRGETQFGRVLELPGVRPLTLAGLVVNRELRGLAGWLARPVRPWLPSRLRAQLARWRGYREVEPWWLLRTARWITSSSLEDYAPRIDAPALIIKGTRDHVVSPTHTRTLTRLLPDARYVELRGRGHHPMEDDFEAFEDEVERFLTSERLPTLAIEAS